MMQLRDILLIGANSARTKAYLQILGQNGLLPVHTFIMANEAMQVQMNKDSKAFSESEHAVQQEQPVFFNIDEPVLYTLNKYNMNYSFITTDTINSELVTHVLKDREEHYLIYSGFGGQILKKPILSMGKKFIHIHPGVVPDYRGSTTIYYSLLKEGRIGASAIFLDEKIDCGPLLKTKWFDLPGDLPDLDYIFDPYVRASLLVEVIQEYLIFNEFRYISQSNHRGETYYITHPVLKHIAILSLR